MVRKKQIFASKFICEVVVSHRLNKTLTITFIKIIYILKLFCGVVEEREFLHFLKENKLMST